MVSEAMKFNPDQVYKELSENGWNRTAVALKFRVSQGTMMRWCKRLKDMGYKLQAYDSKKTWSREMEVRGMPSNAERLRYLDNPSVRW